MEYLAGAPALSNSEVDEVVVTGSRIARLAELGDYKIYTLPETTDVLARQTKQVRFLEQAGVRFSRIYQAQIDSSDTQDGATPQLLIRMRNDAQNGLGLPLPGGGVSLMERHDGRPSLGGQAKFEDRGVGLAVELPFGEAMGVSLSQTSSAESGRRGGTGWSRYAVEVTVANAKSEAVEVELVPQETDRRGFRIVRSSVRSVITDAGVPAFTVRVPAGGTQTLTYTVQFED
jgi:hypothetical protein